MNGSAAEFVAGATTGVNLDTEAVCCAAEAEADRHDAGTSDLIECAVIALVEDVYPADTEFGGDGTT